MEAEVPQDPQLILAQKIFLLRLAQNEPIEKQKLEIEILEEIFRKSLLTTYISLAKDFGWKVDTEQVVRMQSEIDAELKKLDDKIEDAKENLGENEVREALLAKTNYFISIGDKDRSLAQIKVTEEKTVAVGQKMDLAFLALRVAFYHMDFPLIASSLDNAKKLFERGGDWERKNRLKVYEGLFRLASRDFKTAAQLFLDAIATFTCTELMPYKSFVFYTVLVCVVSLDRVALKQKVMDAPEILTVIDQIPHLADFLNSLHACNYKSFFQAFSGISPDIRQDRYLHPHFRHYLREVRLVAYTQFLEPYKSVALSQMARSFGVSEDFIDKELSIFIASGRVNCKIDKVAGVLETNRPDVRNAQYQALIRQGDLLLNRVQKLSRVIDV